MYYFGFILSLTTLLTSCANPPKTTASLGYEDSRRVVIVGENVKPVIAKYYEKKYNSLVWFTPYEGIFVNKANNFLQSGIGPSVAMRSLIKELKSINQTVGQWEIIVPKIAENYFLATLKQMDDHSLSKARGVVVLVDSKENVEIENQLKRVTDDYFFVTNDTQN